MLRFRIKVMQQNLITKRMSWQTFQTQTTFLKISQQIQNSELDRINSPQYAFYKLTLKLPIDCQSNSEANFVRQLTISLQQSLYFQFVVHLTPVSSDFWPHTTKTSSFLFNHFIAYCLILRLNSVQKQRAGIEKEFKEKCYRMHQILNVLKGKYKMQTRLSFWVKRFNELLKQSQAHQKERRLNSPSMKDPVYQRDLAENKISEIINEQNQFKN